MRQTAWELLLSRFTPAAENWKIFVSIMFHHPWLPRGGLCCHKIAWKPLWGAYLLFWWYKFIVKRCKNTQLQAKCPAFKILLRSIQSNYRERPVICIYNSGAAGTNLCLFGGTAYDTLTSETRQRLQEKCLWKTSEDKRRQKQAKCNLSITALTSQCAQHSNCRMWGSSWLLRLQH